MLVNTFQFINSSCCVEKLYSSSRCIFFRTRRNTVPFSSCSTVPSFLLYIFHISRWLLLQLLTQATMMIWRLEHNRWQGLQLLERKGSVLSKETGEKLPGEPQRSKSSNLYLREPTSFWFQSFFYCST